MKPLQIIVTILLFSCSSADKKSNVATTKPFDTILITLKDTTAKLYFHKLNKLFTTGDFDGDGIKDTIYQRNFSRLYHIEIDSSADPVQNEWAKVIKWFNDQQSDVYLTFNSKNRDTLHLGRGQGLYCLLNLGDINKDGKDEIAFVIDHLDYSNVNSCFIYSLCKGKWTLLKQFEINESSFMYQAGTKPTFSNIAGNLEKKYSKWFYQDNQDEVPQMTLLKLNKCD